MIASKQTAIIVEQLEITWPGADRGFSVMVSAGATAVKPIDPELSRELVNTADQALYRAKSEGRDRVAFERPSAS